MKKLLLILICLFVFFEVKSKEIILVCKVSEEKLYRDEKSGDEIRAIEKSIFKNFNSKTELFYLNRKRKWLGEKEYSFKKKGLEKAEPDQGAFGFVIKNEFYEYEYFFREYEGVIDSTIISKDLRKKGVDLSNTLQIILNTYDGTITYAKYYIDDQLRQMRRNFDFIPSGSPIYNVVLKKGVCKKSKGKLF